MEQLTLIKVFATSRRGAVVVTSKKMDESDVPIEQIKAEIQESLDRAKALVVESERFARDRVLLPPEAQPGS